MQNRKETAWRKSRKFGDVYGGRKRPKSTDNIFRRLHSLNPPAPGQQTPILIEENPSRDFFFPLSGQEALDALQKLPAEHISNITHLWLRKMTKSEYEDEDANFAEFICGSKVRVVILYPWPCNLVLSFGQKRPSKRTFRRYNKWTEDLVLEDNKWFLRWTKEGLKQFYIEHLLFHEVGHHVDWYNRNWSKANNKQAESFANQYAVYWSQHQKEIFSSLESQANID